MAEMLSSLSSRLALIRACLFLAAAMVVVAPSADAAPRAGAKIDVALVLAVDVSWSMDRDEQRIQRDGYAAAFRSREVVDAILNGGYGRIAVTYVEWAGAGTQIPVVPWTLIASRSDAERFAQALAMEGPAQMRRTSISGVIDYARGLFGRTGYVPLRRILDISGDGPNNEGRPVTAARDAAVGDGITINGLPLMTDGHDGFGYSIDNLDAYYGDCVIGGGQAFVIPVTNWKEFPVALRRKLVLELAGAPEPEWFVHRAAMGAGVRTIPVQALRGPKTGSGTNCLIGEEMWRQRWKRWDRQ